MPPYLRLVLGPLLTAVAGASVLLTAAAVPTVPWERWVPGLLGLGSACWLWWLTLPRWKPWTVPVFATATATAFGVFCQDLLWSGDPGARLVVEVATLLLTGIGTFVLAPFPLAALGWGVGLGVPTLLILSGAETKGAAVGAGAAMVLWAVVCGFRYVNHRKIAQAWEALELRGRREPVSGLDRLKSFQHKVDEQWARVPPAAGLLMVLTVDRLKQINEAHGLAFGDQLLQAVADRIVAGLTPQDSACRVGGAEIAVLMAGGDVQTRVDRRARTLLETCRGHYSLEGIRVQVGISAGLAHPVRQGGTALDWMNQARRALSRAWETGGNGTIRYDPGVEEKHRRRLRWSADLETALAREEFFLEFQPLVDANTGRPVGAEALVRWNHPQEGQIPPLDFIALAEETGQIAALGPWILDRALAVAKTWPPTWGLSVNVSARQLVDPTFPGQVWTSLERHGVAPQRLTLEITESVLIDDGHRAKDVLEAFRRGRIRISLDDFGTGYSSLLYLMHYPLDELKVDQSFIRSLEGHSASLTIVETVLSLARSLGISTTAEGIENQGQADILRRFGCHVLQGYYFSHPVRDPLTAFLD